MNAIEVRGLRKTYRGGVEAVAVALVAGDELEGRRPRQPRAGADEPPALAGGVVREVGLEEVGADPGGDGAPDAKGWREDDE